MTSAHTQLMENTESNTNHINLSQRLCDFQAEILIQTQSPATNFDKYSNLSWEISPQKLSVLPGAHLANLVTNLIIQSNSCIKNFLINTLLDNNSIYTQTSLILKVTQKLTNERTRQHSPCSYPRLDFQLYRVFGGSFFNTATL